MLNSLGRSRDSKHWNGFHARQIPVDAHEGKRRDVLRRHESVAKSLAHKPRSKQEPVLEKLLDLVADTRVLRVAFDKLRCEGGQSPGPNGLRYDDLDRFGEWEMIEALSKPIKEGTYRPGPTRDVKIPKSSGGTRTLSLANIEDRVVAKAVFLVIQPLLDPTFEDCSFGGRPGRNREGALAHARYQAEAQGRQIWVIADIKSAFDKIPFGRLMDLLQQRFPKDLCLLIERLVRRKVKEKVTKQGIQQGCSLSPLLLNLFLDCHLDKVWKREFPDLPLIRTVDYILVPVSCKEDVDRAQEGLQELLVPAGLPLQEKKSEVIHLTKGESTVWLGYGLGWQSNQLDIHIPEGSWEALEEAFQKAYESPFPSQSARECVMGWLDQLGPAYQHKQQTLDKVFEMAAKYAHDELPAREEMAGGWGRAYGRWESTYGKLPLPSKTCNRFRGSARNRKLAKLG
ncbi:MAG: reverse transcriptase domain-containing protein [Pirellulales bacterium]